MDVTSITQHATGVPCNPEGKRLVFMDL